MNLGQNLKQYVKVFIRQRPFTKSESDLRTHNAVHQITSKEITLKQSYTEKKYHFDEVFDDTASQAEVYKVVVCPLIDYTISGYNCTAFAYGQTGTGKTHTMIGGNIGPNVDFEKDPLIGMIPRAATHLFSRLSKLDAKQEYTVKVSFIEIYNEEVRDLLTTDSPPLRVFDDPENKGSIYMKGVTEATVCNTRDVFEWLTIGNNERQTAATNLNRQSSRSHTLFTLLVHTREITVDGEELIKTGKLHLVDLAGSENIGRSGATDVRAREAGTINKSLLTLGKVIKALAQKMQHIPYRDSKLTRILQDSLGGKTKTCMIATISPCMNSWDETISTLEYANVARNVANCPQVNVNRKQANILKDFKEEIQRLRQELSAARTGEGFYISHDNFNTMNQEMEKKNGRLLELVKQVNRLEEEQVTMNVSFTKTREYLAGLEKTLEERHAEVKQKDFIIDYFDKRDTEISTTAETLLNVCQTSTKHEDILHKKYQRQCDTTLQNANLAKNLSTLSEDCLKSIENTSEAFSKNQQDSYAKMNDCMAFLKDCHSENLNILEENSQLLRGQMQEILTFNDIVEDPEGLYLDARLQEYFKAVFNCMENEKINVIKMAFKYLSEFNETRSAEENGMMNLILESFCKSKAAENKLFTKKEELFEQYRIETETAQAKFKKVETNMQEIEALALKITTLLANTKEEYQSATTSFGTVSELAQQVNSVDTEHKNAQIITNVEERCINYHKHQEEYSKTNTQLVDNYSAKITDCANFVSAERSKSEKYLTDFNSVVQDNLQQINANKLADLKKILERTEGVKRTTRAVALKKTEDVSGLRDKVSELDRNYTADIKQFTRTTLTNIQQTENNVVNVAHSGDTPARQTYNFPTIIRARLPNQILLEKFRENDSVSEAEEIVENGFGSASTSSTP